MNLEKEQARENIIKWLSESEVVVSVITPNEKNDYALKVKLPKIPIELKIICPKSFGDRVVTGWSVELVPDDQRAFMVIPPTDKSSLQEAIRMAVCLMNLDFNCLPNYAKLQSMHCSKIVYFNGLSKNRILDVLYWLANANSFVAFQFQRHGVNLGSSDTSDLT